MNILLRLVSNVRLGLATNSSSSHSLVYGRADHSSAQYKDTDFGWDWFRLDTLGDKLIYVLTDKLGGYWDSNSPSTAELYEKYKHLFSEFDINDFELARSGYVDHQSSGKISIEDARNPDYVIVGGNDNDEAPYGWYDNEVYPE